MVYTDTVGKKFYPDGRVRLFPGNTVIAFGDSADCNAYMQARWVQARLLELPCADKFTLLPASSFHMTIIQLICDQARRAEHWSSRMPLETPLAVMDQFFIQTVPAVPAPTNFRMTFQRLQVGAVGMSIRLSPADESTAAALQAYRDAVADITGVRFPDHDTYAFHISLAYQIQHLTPAEQPAFAEFVQQVNAHLNRAFGLFDSGPPVLTFFDDMFQFVPVKLRHTLVSRRKGSDT